MKKPEPQELVIEKMLGLDKTIALSIPKCRPEIKSWIEANAAEFGDLSWSTTHNQYNLFVSANYSTDEVLAYLRDAWTDAQTPAECPEQI